MFIFLKNKDYSISSLWLYKLIFLLILFVFLTSCASSNRNVSEITDQKTLEEIALEDENKSRRGSAVLKIKNQKILAQIAMGDDNWKVRHYAIKNLIDQNLLSKLAFESKHKQVRSDATKKINNQNVLTQIALNDSDSSVRKKAIDKLTDQSILTQIVLEDNPKNSELIRQSAVRRLTDQNTIKKIALNEKNDLIRREAIGALTDQSLLKKMATRHNYRDAEAAMQNINDLKFLEHQAYHNTFKVCRAIAASKLSDKTTLNDLKAKKTDIVLAVVALKLALMDPNLYPITKNFKIEVSSNPTPKQKYGYHRIKQTYNVSGESISLGILDGKNYIQSRIYITSFPRQTNKLFIPANIKIKPFLKRLLTLTIFNNIDLSSIAFTSDVWELRWAAISRIYNKKVLLKISKEDKNKKVRDFASDRL